MVNQHQHQLMKQARASRPIEDELREKLLKAETRILQLEREVKILRSPDKAAQREYQKGIDSRDKKIAELQEIIATNNAKHKAEKHAIASSKSPKSTPEMKFLRMWYPEGFGANAETTSVPTQGMLTSAAYVFRAFAGRCFYCQCELQEHTVTVDHQIPKSKGGTRARNNIVASCRACNNAKGDRMPTDAELERANTIRQAYDNRPPSAEPMVAVSEPKPQTKPSPFVVRREKSLAEIETEIEEKMALERELFGKARAR